MIEANAPQAEEIEASVIAGRAGYEVTEGEVLLDGKDVFAMAADERARAGIFLAFQYPVEIPGVTTSNFLKTAINAKRRDFIYDCKR